MKKAIALLLTLCMVFTLAACSSGSSTDSPASGTSGDANTGETKTAFAAAPKYTLKWSHVSSTDYPYHVAAEKVAEEVYQKTNGEVKIDIYPSNQLGSQAETTEGLISGVVDIVCSSASVLSGYAAQVAVSDIPFIFKSREHAYAVFDDPELSAEIFAGVEENLGPVVAVWENSMRSFINTKHEIHSPADFVGLKFRSMQSKAFLSMFEALGATSTAMSAGEIYTSLQQGTIDGADGTIASLYTERYWEVAPYVTISNHAYSITPIVVSPMLETKIGPEYYQILIETIQAYTDWERQYATEYESVFLQELEDTGITINYLTDDEIAVFIEACKPVKEAMEETCGADLINKIANYNY